MDEKGIRFLKESSDGRLSYRGRSIEDELSPLGGFRVMSVPVVPKRRGNAIVRWEIAQQFNIFPNVVKQLSEFYVHCLSMVDTDPESVNIVYQFYQRRR